MPPLVGAVISGGMATLIECQTVYGLEDVYDMFEIMMVDAHNRRVMRKLDAER